MKTLLTRDYIFDNHKFRATKEMDVPFFLRRGDEIRPFPNNDGVVAHSYYTEDLVRVFFAPYIFTRTDYETEKIAELRDWHSTMRWEFVKL